MICWVQPDLMGTPSEFKEHFSDAIRAGQEPSATATERLRMVKQLSLLRTLTQVCVLGVFLRARGREGGRGSCCVVSSVRVVCGRGPCGVSFEKVSRNTTATTTKTAQHQPTTQPNQNKTNSPSSTARAPPSSSATSPSRPSTSSTWACPAPSRRSTRPSWTPSRPAWAAPAAASGTRSC